MSVSDGFIGYIHPFRKEKKRTLLNDQININSLWDSRITVIFELQRITMINEMTGNCSFMCLDHGISIQLNTKYTLVDFSYYRHRIGLNWVHLFSFFVFHSLNSSIWNQNECKLSSKIIWIGRIVKRFYLPFRICLLFGVLEHYISCYIEGITCYI